MKLLPKNRVVLNIEDAVGAHALEQSAWCQLRVANALRQRDLGSRIVSSYQTCSFPWMAFALRQNLLTEARISSADLTH